MAVYIGDTLIAASIDGQQLNNPFSLLDYKYSEYELSNASWLLSNGQYNSGATYPAVYNLLLQIYNGTVTKNGVSVKLSTEAYADTDFVLNTGDTTFRLPLYTQRVLVKKYVSGTNWYDLYSDGWCEQGGIVTGVTSTYQSVNLSRAYTDINYNLIATLDSDVVGNQYTVTTITSASTFKTKFTGTGTGKLQWRACGYSAVPSVSEYTEIKGIYFYVGETVQDANIIAAASVLTDMTNIKNGVGYSSLGTSFLSGMGMPSDTYDDLTLGASGATYTAPANGWFLVDKLGSEGQYMYAANAKKYTGTAPWDYSGRVYAQSVYGPIASSSYTLWIPCQKGDRVCINYNASGAIRLFRFIYAEGEENV